MTTTDRRALISSALTALAALFFLTVAPSADAADDAETQAKHARSGAGLRLGAWVVRGLADAGGTASQTPAIEGYFQKGLDLHLAWENTLGFWQRTHSFTDPGALGGSGSVESRSIVITSLTSLKLYPATRPSSVLEPYLSAGLGVILGIDRQQTSGAALGSPTESTTLHTGLGLKGGVGVDWHFSRALGLSARGHYQWAGFGEDVGGERTYQGLGADIGLTYRFQYE